MTITVRDLWQYKENFDYAVIQRLTGKNRPEKTDTVDLIKLAALNDKNLSVFVAEKEGKSFLNFIKDNNMRTQIADTLGLMTETDKNGNIPSCIPMDKSVFNIARQEYNYG